MYNPDLDSFELERDKPLVLLLGSIAHEGVLSLLQASDRQYKQKLLRSKPENWQLIVDYFSEFEITSVLIKLDPSVISFISSPAHQEVAQTLFKRIAEKPNMVFVYEDLLTGLINQEEDFGYRQQPTQEQLNSVLAMLEALELDLMPYRRNAQVTVLAESFLLDTEQNLLFRLYVPSNRIWSDETDKMLQLFREYLSNVRKLSVRLDQQRTNKGTIYEFHGDDSTKEQGISAEFAEFTNLLDLCLIDQSAAEALLRNKSTDTQKISELLARYSKEAKRLHIDLKHDRERKVMSIQQRLESELVEEISDDVDWNAVMELIESTVPLVSSANSLLGDVHRLGPKSDHYQSSSVTINLNPQMIGTVNGVVAQEINGNQDLGVQGRQLLDLIEMYGGKSSGELSSAVHAIEDKSSPKSLQLKSGQMLKKFMFEIGRKGGDVAVGVLQKYIENQLGI